MMSTDVRTVFDRCVNNLDAGDRVSFLLAAVGGLRAAGATIDEAYDTIFGHGHYDSIISVIIQNGLRSGLISGVN